MTTRIMLVDDQVLLRHSLRIVIDQHPDLKVVAEAADGAEAIALAAEHRPHVALMDIRMPVIDGITATERIVAAHPEIRILILSMFELDEYVYGALRAGASGFLLKDAGPTQLIAAIRRTRSGESLFAPSILTRLIEHFLTRPGVASPGTPSRRSRSAVPNRASLQGATIRSQTPLTPRESETLTLVGRGFSNTEIAAALTISMGTVKTHIGSLLAKLHVRDRAQLVIAAYERGLV